MSTPAPDPEQTARIDSDAQRTPRSRRIEAQFAPGTIIAGRYRIAGILGAGGMGEVYRADDVKLDQTVALKFLPARLARDPILLARLHDEVRLGRQIAHPNVCRIYDIVEWEGAHFVAMEYVDGEDLARLLRRIGRLAHDKAVDIARGIAAGLHAAHAKGILHRDLKPANVMIDSHGEPRIMDFGLALAAGEDDGTISGTPAYMAPEQLAGQPATVQSDLYALGLVMYELFTGKRVHHARSLQERVRDVTSEITMPSSVIRDLDPAVERLILRCLSNDPAQRPRSAREVVESLPGGDPLAAALRAGETPSPRIVAAAGAQGSLSRTAAWSMLTAIAALFALALYVRSVHSLGPYAPPMPSPEVLHDRATAFLRTFDVPAEGSPIATLLGEHEYHAWLIRHSRWEAMRRGPSLVTYRLEYGGSKKQSEVLPRVSSAPGRTDVEVDAQGRLLFLMSTPRGEIQPRALDWSALLGAAGLEFGSLRPIPPRFLPSAPFDTLRAWSGTYPGDRTPIRVEAAAWRGVPTFFRITGPWNDVANPFEGVAFSTTSIAAFLYVISAIVIVGGLLLAWANLRRRRGDRQTALRLAVVIFLADLGARWLPRLSAGRPHEAADLLALSAGMALLMAAMMYVFYIALEPLIRRRWPSLLIAWTRLFSGNVRDPMVGRDVMIGLIGGLLHLVIARGADLLMTGDGRTIGPEIGDTMSLLGIRFSVAEFLNAAAGGILFGTVQVVVLALLLMIVRRRGIAAGVFCGLFLTGYVFALAGDYAALPFVILLALLFTFIAARYGLLALVVTHAAFGPLLSVPHVSTSWAAPMTAVPYALVALLALWAFRTSLGGQSLIGEEVLGD
jgi:hypothetical protein